MEAAAADELGTGGRSPLMPLGSLPATTCRSPPCCAAKTWNTAATIRARSQLSCAPTGGQPMAHIARSAVPAVRDAPGDGLERLMELARHALPGDRRRLEGTI